MKEIKIKISDKSYNVKLAETDEQKEKGLMNIKELPENEGMLFVFDESDEVSIWMKDTLIPLDIIFIDEDLTVINVQKGKPESEDFMTEQNVCLVLEVNQNSGIKRGDELEFSPESKTKLDKMIVLNEDGSPQMELEGGERIFSRANTKTLIKFAKKANSTQKDNDFIALGKRVFKFLETQDNNDPEFVELKN
jgi:uncharacterized membrane protein (UPF0127 family)